MDVKITAKYMQSALLKKALCHLIILDNERKTGKKQKDCQVPLARKFPTLQVYVALQIHLISLNSFSNK